MPTYASDADGFASPNFGGDLGVRYGTIEYTDTTAKLLFTLPEGAVIVDFYCDVKTAFDDSGTDLLNVGTAGNPDAYVDDLAGGTAALTRMGGAATLPRTDAMGAALTNDTPIYGVYAGQNANATAGVAVFVMFYILQ